MFFLGAAAHILTTVHAANGFYNSEEILCSQAYFYFCLALISFCHLLQQGVIETVMSNR